MGHHQLDTLDEQILKLIATTPAFRSWKWQERAMFRVRLFINAYRS